MTHTPQSGQAAPVDPTTEPGARRDSGSHGSSAFTPEAGASSNGVDWSSTSTTSAAPKLPRPDTPTESVPVVTDPAAAAPTSSTTTGSTQRAAGPQASRRRARGPRRAQLQLRHINPWTVLKFSCVLAIALFFVWLIMVGVLYGILDASGVISRVNDAWIKLKGDGGTGPVTAGVVFGTSAIIGLIDIVLFIALSTIGSVVYNLCADLVGGVEVTLSER